MKSPCTPADKAAPVVVQKKAIDVTPYNHALWCSVEGGKPFANTIYWRSWSNDGTEILFGLDTHNRFSAAPDELMGVVEVRGPEDTDYLAEKLREDADKMAKRPTADAARPQSEAKAVIAELDRRSTVIASLQSELAALRADLAHVRECAAEGEKLAMEAAQGLQREVEELRAFVDEVRVAFAGCNWLDEDEVGAIYDALADLDRKRGAR